MSTEKDSGLAFLKTPPLEVKGIEATEKGGGCQIEIGLGGMSTYLILTEEQTRELHHQTGEYIDVIEGVTG